MRTVADIGAVRRMVAAARGRGLTIGFVPTMGFLHEGHLRLVDEARHRCGFVVLSVFVNPLQFGPGEDLTRYPRDAAGDQAKAAGRGVDVFFLPDEATMYARSPSTTVVPAGLDRRWEGAIRPGHFVGVCTVVAKLFHIVQPDVAVFGQKDVQQATIIRAMVRDLDFPVDVVVRPTVREPDGLAMSSRNSYLSPVERGRALVLWRALSAVARAFEGGTRAAAELEAVGRRLLTGEPEVRVDYFAIVSPTSLEPVDVAEPGCIVMVAARVGSTRLLDNLILGHA
jgi:pantoate--beta-alanine ligase